MEDEEIDRLTKRSKELIQRSKKLIEKSQVVLDESRTLRELTGVVKAKRQKSYPDPS